MGPGDLSGGAGGRRCWRGPSQEPDLSPEAPHVQLVGFWHKRGRDEEPLGRREAPAPQPRGPQEGRARGPRHPARHPLRTALREPPRGDPSQGTCSGQRGPRRGRRRLAGGRTSWAASTCVPSPASTPSVLRPATRGRAAGHRGPLSSAGGLCDDLAVQNPPRDRCPGNGRPSARQQAGHPHRRLGVLLEPSSLSGKVTTVNGSAGHCAPTGGLRCPGDGLRQNEVLFHAEMTGRCLQRTKPSCSWQGTPCPSPSRVRYGAAGTLPASSGPSLGGCFVPLLRGPSLEPGRVRGCTRSRLQTRKCRHVSGQTHLGTVTTARKL